MNINHPRLITLITVLIFTSLYSCKKNETETDLSSQAKYNQLPLDVSKVAQWYDKQTIGYGDRNITDQNSIDWGKTIKSTMPNGSLVYALPISSTNSITRVLNINRTNSDELYAVVKEYSLDIKTGSMTLTFFDIRGNLIQQGLFRNGRFSSFKNKSHLIMNVGNGEGDPKKPTDGIDIGVDEDGDTIVVITAPPPSSDPVFTLPDFPSGPDYPSFPADPGYPSPVGGGGGDSNPSIITNRIKDPCLKAIVDNLLNKNFQDKMSEVISNLATSTKLNITFDDAEYTSDGAAANTHDVAYDKDSHYLLIFVTLSHDKLLGTSKEYATTAIIHEIVHGFFSSTAGGISIDKPHEMMADSFVSPMASYLTQLYPDLSIQNATALVWSGISDIKSYKDSDNFTYPGGSMTKDELKAIYANYVAKIYGTGVCN